MTRSSSDVNIQEVKPALSLPALMVLLLVIICSTVLALRVLPNWLPGLSSSIIGTQPKVFWFVSRSSAIIAYLLLWLSMIIGVGITNKTAAIWPGLPTAIELHQYLSILGLFIVLSHILILLGDSFLKLQFLQILIPFSATQYRPFSVGLGQIGLYLWIILIASFYIRKKIGSKTWRILHSISFVTYLVGLIHGITAGTDAAAPWAKSLYWMTLAILLFMTIYRILRSRENNHKEVIAGE